MSEALPWGILCGLVLGVGVWSIVSALPGFRRPRLVDRVAPFVVDVSVGAREHLERMRSHPLPLLGSVAAPIVHAVRRSTERLLAGQATVARLLAQAGSPLTVEAHRNRQLVWAGGGLLAGVVLVVAASASVGSHPLAGVLVPVVATVMAFTACDHLLRRRATRRLGRIREEFPTVLEMITLSLSAGEGIFDAIRRVSAASGGELAREFRAVVAAVHAGVPLSDALVDLEHRLGLPVVTRCVEQLVAALERGSPLVDVLRAQVGDAREQAKRELLELAGTKEVAMMIPLVFLILPQTVLFALLPGVLVFQTGF
ncbi:type II secretion system F family protein [Compostimonas suwonensis]|uniref:Tight adherence protein C n=1 Tax=Compostimonas suwonensis TaxID=1048394 RepID=A0A2M9BWP7_9MICO|nr:type II secretion system F family protein [Compostimonas suwonensis]PJJ62376.1 tight adherence protein C [Compostimonas suwonensis]